MTDSQIYPLGTSGQFPDNGILSQMYDSRVSQNDMLRISRSLIHEVESYYKEETILGLPIYIWNQEFIAMVQKSILENKISNFSKVQRKLFDQYVVLITNGVTASTSADAIALKTYIDSLVV
jgi:hypothetical protein